MNHLIGHRFSIQFEVSKVNPGSDYPISANYISADGTVTPYIATFKEDGRVIASHNPVTTFPEALQIPWDECPWAQYAAMDKDGDWFFYSHEPVKRSNVWDDPDDKYAVCGDFKFPPVANWNQSLVKRPNTKF